MRKFNRIAGRRRIFLQSLMTNLVMRERITTTEARAKEVRPRLERMVTVAKRQRGPDLRLLLRAFPKSAAYKLFHEIAPRYKERKGGYLRIAKIGTVRKRDGVSQAVIEFVKS